MRLLVRDGPRIVPLMVEEIEHLRSDTKYTAVTSRGRSYLVRLPIASFEKRLRRSVIVTKPSASMLAMSPVR